ncbi:MAG: hypothetical protein FWH41_06235, partial [Treponema sp.]|nr:hypothetical protein [Treponema sp.]
RPLGRESNGSSFGTLGIKPESNSSGERNTPLLAAGYFIEDIPEEKNLIFKAITLFKRYSGKNFLARINVDKHIPCGAGLGGGSSDAAATLLALNKLVSPDEKSGLLDYEKLAEIGFALGSDVPFFLHNCPAALVCGKGEKVQPFKLPNSVNNLFFLLVYPGFPSSTAQSFYFFDLWRELHASNEIQFLNVQNISDILSNPPETWPFKNDFLPAFLSEMYKNQGNSELACSYEKIFASLQGLGACFSGLSGAGSTCFGVFSDGKKALFAKDALLKEWPFVVLANCCP